MMKTWLILLLTLSMSSWAQTAKTDGDDCINCEGPRPVMNASLNLMDNYAPSEDERRAICGAYFSGLSHRPIALYYIGLTEEQYFQNYEHFVCDRGTLPITHLIVTHGSMDIVELEKDLIHLESLNEEARFRIVNRVIPGRRYRGTQLDMIQVHIERVKGQEGNDPEYIPALRRIRDRFIAMGAKSYSDLTPEEERRLGFEPLNDGST